MNAPPSLGAAAELRRAQAAASQLGDCVAGVVEAVVEMLVGLERRVNLPLGVSEKRALSEATRAMMLGAERGVLVQVQGGR